MVLPKINVLIVDDEELGRRRIRELLEGRDGIRIIGESGSADEAILSLKRNKPDLLFLDIQLENTTGFDVLETLPKQDRPLVVFVTAYDEYALKAFEHFAFDYLLKPFSDQRFYESLTKATAQINLLDQGGYTEKLDDVLSFIRHNQSVDIFNQKLPIRTANKTNFINKPDIKYILASGYYAEIYAKHKMHVLRSSLPDILENLKDKKFIRIHRSTIINIDHISEIVHSDYGEIDVRMSDNNLFRLSKSYKRKFMETVGI